jgi:RNA polymerase sigma-70 factor, ECF subfamily
MTDWSQIVEQHGPLVWRTAQRLLCHEADTADCFQRTFISALELSRQETIQHWPALLRRLATARALEQLRQRIRERRRSANGSDRICLDRRVDQNTIDPDDAAESSELANHLRIALTEIDPRQAEVFCLACLDDCSYAEIAEQLGVIANHVGVLLNRAKASLRERLKAHDPKSDVAGEKSGGKR